MTDLQYPVGRFTKVTELAPAKRAECIEEIAQTPGRMSTPVTPRTSTAFWIAPPSPGWAK